MKKKSPKTMTNHPVIGLIFMGLMFMKSLFPSLTIFQRISKVFPLYFNLFLYFNVFLCISTYSQSYSQSDSLNQYLVIAAKNNPSVLQKFYEYKAALQKVPQVGSLPDPELNVGVFIQPMELVDGKQVADIRLMQMFP